VAGVKSVLIYRLGSIGDFVIALPCLHLVRRRFPEARVVLLTNLPVEARAAPAASVFEGSGLVDAILTYQLGTRDLRRLQRLRDEIRGLGPDLFVYLASRNALWRVARDYLYFKSCGIDHMVGFPFVATDRLSRAPVMKGGHWGHEGQRLARCLAPLGDAEPWEEASWDLRLTEAETVRAERLIGEVLPPSAGRRSILGLSIGTKQAINDWGGDNWRAVLRRLADADRPLLLIGSGEERARSQTLAEGWPGPVLNFCCSASQRVSAALVARTALFLCHDSGPMHLAAAVGTRCVAVFSRRNPPGQWFPFGTGHRIFYPQRPNETIQAVPPEAVAEAALEILAERRPRWDGRGTAA
jgi:lipopolysaccharide heptosyltransferase III